MNKEGTKAKQKPKVIQKTKKDDVNILKNAKSLVLKEWDVSFSINGEMLINVLNYLMEVNTDIPWKFFSDRMFLHLKSPDNVQYAELEINQTDILDYSPGIDGESNRKDAKSVINGEMGEYKFILVDMKGTIDEIEQFAPKNDVVLVRVDTVYHKKIEFHCGNAIIWAAFFDTKGNPDIKGLDRLPKVISSVRTDARIRKAVAMMEPATFTKICNIGGKGKQREIDERIYMSMDKEEGMYISSGDNLKGRLFMFSTIDNMRVEYGGDGVDGSENFNSDNYTENGDTKQVDLDHDEQIEGDVNDGSGNKGIVGKEGSEGTNTSIEKEIDIGTGIENQDTNISEFEAMSYGGDDLEGLEEIDGMSSTDIDSVPDKKNEEKERTEQKNIDQLLSLELDADIRQQVYLDKKYMIPFVKLRGLSPITVEIRTNKPIILEQRPYNSVRALLSVAPRIENSEDMV